ncbi:TetR/AcrR family transcriptional regulator [Paeniglutamicibacter antarcticus]|uniref:TetR/AcrR family transcriptional regulator n=1 Tax=Arthrobacter terrae TaxID=2935737 RepID=A0A931CUH8_9MICC|nr:TetR/AcrR family transcriptional regulator [Arthrobacter terrae]MBG0740093.1 TetR/AcrR family transcriptional regulator [Arthrobacter terrae]
MSEPARPAQTRRPVRTNATRQKLFEASMLLIGERGPANVTVDEIAAAAGVSKGTVYYNFGSKSEMIAALLEHGVEMLESRLASASPAAKAVDDLQEMLGAMLDFFAEYPSFAQLLVSEMWRTPGEWHETLTLLRERLVSVIGAAVERVAQENQVDTQITPASVAGAILGATFVIGLDRLVFHPDRSREQALAVVMTVIRGYLR